MRRNWQSRMALALFVPLAAAGCKKDSTGPGDALSQAASLEIANTLMTEVLSVGFQAFGGLVRAGADAQGSVVPFPLSSASYTVNQSVPCQGGGTILVQGSWSDNLTQQGTGTLAFNLSQKPTNCVVPTTQGAFTVNGNPDLSVTADWTVNAWALGVANFTFSGGFSWSGAGGSGSCAINLTYHYNFTSSVYSATGHMCGYDISYSYP